MFRYSHEHSCTQGRKRTRAAQEATTTHADVSEDQEGGAEVPNNLPGVDDSDAEVPLELTQKSPRRGGRGRSNDAQSPTVKAKKPVKAGTGANNVVRSELMDSATKKSVAVTFGASMHAEPRFILEVLRMNRVWVPSGLMNWFDLTSFEHDAECFSEKQEPKKKKELQIPEAKMAQSAAAQYFNLTRKEEQQFKGQISKKMRARGAVFFILEQMF